MKLTKLFRPKKSGIWYARFDHDDGNHSYKSTGTRDRAEAQAVADAFAQPRRSESGPTLSALVPIFAEMFSSLKQNTLDRTYIPYARHFIKAIGDKPPAGYTKEDVELYKKERLGNVSVVTCFMHMKTLQALFARLQKEGYLTDNPFRKVERVQSRGTHHAVLNSADVARLTEHTRPMIRGPILLGFYAGMRLGEILRLNWADVDFRRKLILILQTKTDTPRNVPMANIVAAFLSTLPRRSLYVFHSPGGGNYPAQRCSMRSNGSYGKRSCLILFGFMTYDIRSQLDCWSGMSRLRKCNSSWGMSRSRPRLAHTDIWLPTNCMMMSTCLASKKKKPRPT